MFIYKTELHLTVHVSNADCDNGEGFERGGDVSQTSSLGSNSGSNCQCSYISLFVKQVMSKYFFLNGWLSFYSFLILPQAYPLKTIDAINNNTFCK